MIYISLRVLFLVRIGVEIQIKRGNSWNNQTRNYIFFEA